MQGLMKTIKKVTHYIQVTLIFIVLYGIVAIWAYLMGDMKLFFPVAPFVAIVAMIFCFFIIGD